MNNLAGCSSLTHFGFYVPEKVIADSPVKILFFA